MPDTNRPITRPRYSFNWLDDLKLNAPDVYAQYQKTIIDVPANYRDEKEGKKKPFRPADPFKRPH